MARTRTAIKTKDGITWYYEQEGSGPDIVLIPDGLGECHMFDKPMSIIAAEGFRVTTFDTPGMSRSSDAPPEAYQKVTGQKLAAQIIGLLDELDIKVATFWGSSSGGTTVLALAMDFPNRVRNALPHEAPTFTMDNLQYLADQDDDTISKTMAKNSRNLSGNEEAWDALGEESHARIAKNSVRWARGYPHSIPQSTPTNVEELRGKNKNIDWTVGALTPTWLFWENIIIATKAEVPIAPLAGSHFPYVSHPEVFAEHVVEKTRKYL